MALKPSSRPQLVLVSRLVVTLALLAFAVWDRDQSPGIAGVVVGLIGGYWLPSRGHQST